MNNNRLKWRADRDFSDGSKEDIDVGYRMFKALKNQTSVRTRNPNKVADESLTYWTIWNELSACCRENYGERVLPHTCEFGHVNCSYKPNGICVFAASVFDDLRQTECAWIAAFHDERIQELIGPEAVNSFYQRIAQYDNDLAGDIHLMLRSKGCQEDLAYRYADKAFMHHEEYNDLKGVCPMLSSDNLPEPPCKIF